MKGHAGASPLYLYDGEVVVTRRPGGGAVVAVAGAEAGVWTSHDLRPDDVDRLRSWLGTGA